MKIHPTKLMGFYGVSWIFIGHSTSTVRMDACESGGPGQWAGTIIALLGKLPAMGAGTKRNNHLDWFPRYDFLLVPEVKKCSGQGLSGRIKMAQTRFFCQKKEFPVRGNKIAQTDPVWKNLASQELVWCWQRGKNDWQEARKFDCQLVQTIFIFCCPLAIFQDIGQWPENQILIPDWAYFHCPGATLLKNQSKFISFNSGCLTQPFNVVFEYYQSRGLASELERQQSQGSLIPAVVIIFALVYG